VSKQNWIISSVRKVLTPMTDYMSDWCLFVVFGLVWWLNDAFYWGSVADVKSSWKVWKFKLGKIKLCQVKKKVKA
jgi:hypothetical protein